MVVVATPCLPSASVTVSRTSCRPFSVNVRETWASVASVSPSPSRSQAYVNSLPSGWEEPVPSNDTTSGAWPFVGVASICATGERPPRT